MRTFKLIIFASLLISPAAAFSQQGIIERVPELQKTARRAIGGAMGCGVGSFVLVEGETETRVGGGLDPIHVFGNRIELDDILTILEARSEKKLGFDPDENKDEVGALLYVTLTVAIASKSPKVISVVKSLLLDEIEVVRAWSAIALIKLAESDPELKEAILPIGFPKSALAGAKSRSYPIPTWVRSID